MIDVGREQGMQQQVLFSMTRRPYGRREVENGKTLPEYGHHADEVPQLYYQLWSASLG
jgi:hypothetical protein